MNIRGMPEQFIKMLPTDKNICLLGLQGSRGHGFAVEADADYDYRGIFISRNDEILSLDRPKETLEFGSSGDNEAEFVLHEVEKFFRLSIQGNPSVISLLFLPKFNIKDNVGDTIVANRELFLSEPAIRKAFGGYAMSQILYLKRNHKFRDGKKIAKHIKHCFRLFDEGQELLETGKITLPLKDAQKYLRISEMNDEQAWQKMFEERNAEFMSCKSILPKEVDRTLINGLLLKIRGVI